MSEPGGVTLVRFGPEHVARTYEWVSDPELRRLFMMRGELTPEGHSAYFASVLADPSQRLFAILVTGAHVGNCGLKHLRAGGTDAELWIYIGDALARGKGVGRAATEALIRIAFGELGLDRLRLHLARSNEPALALYRGLGFVETTGPAEGEWADRDNEVVEMEVKRTA